MIARLYLPLILERMKRDNQIVLIFGPRQVGKTTLARELLAQMGGKPLSINADETAFHDIFSSRSLSKMMGFVGDHDLLFIDEAQRIPEIGINLKILHDGVPNLKIIATGSSSFDLASKVRESLAGRTWSYQLFPIGVCELHQTATRFELDQKLEDLLVFGSYPHLLSLPNRSEKSAYLREIVLSYLFKDVLDLGTVKYARKIRDLVKMLAFQVGSEVSINELSNRLEISRDTVVSYIDLLEKAFVIIRLSAFSRNLRKEITRHDKIFFTDNGIRNAIIENFNGLSHRDDDGKLWENFLIVERLKSQIYRGEGANRYFWRTYTGAELDYLEERNGKITGFEFKFNSKMPTAPASWLSTYPEADFQAVNRENYFDFLLNG